MTEEHEGNPTTDEKPLRQTIDKASRGLALSLDLHTGGVDLGIADIFQRMRWQRLLPCRRIEFRHLQGVPRVHQNVAKMVTPDALAPALDEDHARPAMSVDGSRRSEIGLSFGISRVCRESTKTLPRWSRRMHSLQLWMKTTHGQR